MRKNNSDKSPAVMRLLPCIDAVHVRQSGQAALEALISLLVLAVLWVAVTWLGRIQDLALHTSHASRFAAFMATRNVSNTPVDAVRQGLFSGPANSWSDRHGHALQDSVYQNIGVTLTHDGVMSDASQLGGSYSEMRQLRQDWLLAGDDIVSARVILVPHEASPGAQASGSGLELHQFDAAYPFIQRHTSILSGAGHSGSDSSTADRIANSALAWADSTERSYRLGRKVDAVASKVDNAWGRPSPVFDWLGPWADQLPAHHFRSSHPSP